MLLPYRIIDGSNGFMPAGVRNDDMALSMHAFLSSPMRINLV
jgi:hypothetical protein